MKIIFCSVKARAEPCRDGCDDNARAGHWTNAKEFVTKALPGRLLKYSLVIVCLFTVLAAGTRAVVASSGEPLILAVHPYLPASDLLTRFTPLATYLSRAIGRPIAVRVGRSYAEHINAIGEDAVDIAYMGPAAYVKMYDHFGPKPLLARQEVNSQIYLRGVIIVRQDSGLRDLSELKGKRFAYGDRDSTMSHVVPRHVLLRAGITPVMLAQQGFLGSHNNVVLAVLSGDYDAGAVKEEVFLQQAHKGLRALATLPPIADHNFVASNRLSPTIVDTLRHSLWRLKDSAEGRAIMNSLHPQMTALVPALDSDYNSLRTLLGKPARPHD